MAADMLLIGTPTPGVRTLADALEAEWLELPALERADWDALERFRRTHEEPRSYQHVVVAVWRAQLEPGVLLEIGEPTWQQRAELPIVTWNVAMGVASRLVADDGAVVAVTEGPAPIDSGGWAPETAVAESAIVLARSLAGSEGGRGVRANCVTTPGRMGGGLLAPPPALPAHFPGTVERDVAGAVRMLLGDDACAVTATVVHADGGRTLR